MSAVFPVYIQAFPIVMGPTEPIGNGGDPIFKRNIATPPRVTIEDNILNIEGIDFSECTAIIGIMDDNGDIIFEEEVSDGTVLLPDLNSNTVYTLNITVGFIRWTGTFVIYSE